MKKTFFIIAILLAFTIIANCQQHDVVTRYETLYVGESEVIEFPTFAPGFATFVSATCTVIKGNVTINSYGNGYFRVTSHAAGSYEIRHYARFNNGSITTTVKGEIIPKNGSSGGGGDEELPEPEPENPDPPFPPLVR